MNACTNAKMHVFYLNITNIFGVAQKLSYSL